MYILHATGKFHFFPTNNHSFFPPSILLKRNGLSLCWWGLECILCILPLQRGKTPRKKKKSGVVKYLIVTSPKLDCPVGWGCRIHWLHLCRGVRPPPYECPGYDTKQSDGEVQAVLELWGMRCTPSLPSLPGPLWPGVVAPDRALSMGWIELTSYLC